VAVRGPSIPDVGQRRALVWEEERISEELKGHLSVLVHFPGRYLDVDVLNPPVAG
jgi:hypothetical protein